MSDDNVVRPEQWRQHAEASLQALASDAGAKRGGSGSGGGGPHYPDMESRVAALETDMKEVKGSLKTLELSTARIEATLATLATKTDIVTLGGRVDVLDSRLGKVEQHVGKVEQAVDKTLAIAVGKAIGPAQFITIIAGSAALITAAVAVIGWLIKQPWFLKS